MISPSSTGAFLPVPPRPPKADPGETQRVPQTVHVVYTSGEDGWSATSPQITDFGIAGSRTLPECSAAARNALDGFLGAHVTVAETAPGATAEDWFPPSPCGDCGCGAGRDRFLAMVGARLAAGEPAGRIAHDEGMPLAAIESIAAAERDKGA